MIRENNKMWKTLIYILHSSEHLSLFKGANDQKLCLIIQTGQLYKVSLYRENLLYALFFFTKNVRAIFAQVHLDACTSHQILMTLLETDATVTNNPTSRGQHCFRLKLSLLNEKLWYSLSPLYKNLSARKLWMISLLLIFHWSDYCRDCWGQKSSPALSFRH